MLYRNVIIYSGLFRGVGSLKYQNVIADYQFSESETREILQEVYKMEFGERARFDTRKVDTLMEELF